jgi:hypothetical protein
MANLRTNNLSGEGGRNAIDGSVFFDGSSKLSVPNSADVRLGSDDFTIEAWIKLGSPAGDWDAILGMWDASNTRRTYTLQRKNSDGELYLYVSTDGGSTNWAFANGGNVTVGDWHHVAGVRDGNTLRVYLNGVEVDNSSYSGTIYNNTTDALFIGDVAATDSNNFNGYISNARICKGHCLYPNGTTFTPPAQKLTSHYIADDNKTVLLCCQDSDNPLQEATGKTITGYGRYEYLNDTELVTNGSGTTTTGWTNANTSTFTVEDGMIKVTRSGGTGPTSYQTITTVTGQQYTVSVNIQHVSGNYSDLRVYNGSDSTGTLLKFLRSTGTSTDGNISSTFTAESTSTTLFFVFDDGGDTGKFSQISVKAADRGKQPKVIPPYGVDAGNTFNGAISMNSQDYMYFPTGRTEERGRGRGIFAGGVVSPNKDIQVVDISSGGIAQDFGDTANTAGMSGSASSSTRMLLTNGYIAPASTNTIEFITIANIASSTDFGDLTVARRRPQSLSNSTRGVHVAGSDVSPAPYLNVIDYNTIASAGNSIDFGDTDATTLSHGGSVASSTRGLYSVAYEAPAYSNVIEFITIATTGNGQDFGDLSAAKGYHFRGSICDTTRGLFAGGYNPAQNTIDFVTMASAGNASDFGDLSQARRSGAGTANSIHSIFAGGYLPGTVNTIDRVLIQTTGNAADFGDLLVKTHEMSGSSDSHGGLS